MSEVVRPLTVLDTMRYSVMIVRGLLLQGTGPDPVAQPLWPLAAMAAMTRIAVASRSAPARLLHSRMA